MTRPLVALPAPRLVAGRVTGWTRAARAVPDTYVEALARAGALCALVPTDEATVDDVVGAADGILLTGGGDVDPARYGAERHPRTGNVDDERDAFELRLARAAVANGKPLLAICRGMQVLNVALGGSLHQHLPEIAGLGQHHDFFHDVHVDVSSRLARACRAEVVAGCASRHHQALDQVAPGLRVVATAADGVVEGVEGNGDAWMVAVQWHPETTAGEDDVQQALFDAFVQHAGAGEGSAVPGSDGPAVGLNGS